MPRAWHLVFLPLLLVGPMPSAHKASTIAGSSGTLIVVVPANGGLVVASDSRQTSFNVACDDSQKIIFPSHPPLSFVAASGTATWINTRFPLWDHDPCGDIAKNGIVFFDVKEFVASKIANLKEPVAKLDLKALAHEVLSKIIELHGSEPAFVRSFAGRTLFTIILGQYEPLSNSSVVRAVDFVMSAKFQISANIVFDLHLSETDKPDLMRFGQAGELQQYVIDGPGKGHLPPAWGEIWKLSEVKDVSISLARDAAVGTIEAAKKTSENVQELKGIGGPVVAYSLSKDGRERLQYCFTSASLFLKRQFKGQAP